MLPESGALTEKLRRSPTRLPGAPFESVFCTGCYQLRVKQAPPSIKLLQGRQLLFRTFTRTSQGRGLLDEVFAKPRVACVAATLEIPTMTALLQLGSIVWGLLVSQQNAPASLLAACPWWAASLSCWDRGTCCSPTALWAAGPGHKSPRGESPPLSRRRFLARDGKRRRAIADLRAFTRTPTLYPARRYTCWTASFTQAPMSRAWRTP